MKHLLYSIIYVFFISSCSVADPIVISNDNLQFKSINDSIIKFTVDTHVLNPSKYNYQLRELLFDINYQDKTIASGLLTKPTGLKPNDTMPLPMECLIDLYKLHKTHKKIFQQETVNLQCIGKAYAVHPLKKTRKDFEFKIPLNTKKVISDNLMSSDLTLNRIGIQKTNLFSIKSLTNTGFYLTIGIYNNQHFDFKIKEIDLLLRSEKTKKVMVQGELDTIIEVPKLQTAKIPFNVESNNLNLFQGIGNYFLNPDDNVYIGTGHMVVSIKGYDFRVPFYKAFHINMNPLGDNSTKDRNVEIRDRHYCSINNQEIENKFRNSVIWRQ